MKKKTNKDQQENYLERKPKRHEAIAWAKDEKGIVTLDIENTGFFNRLAQKFFHKPKVTHIHLDEMGSFVWPSGGAVRRESQSIVRKTGKILSGT